jgi:hypothetical protein
LGLVWLTIFAFLPCAAGCSLKHFLRDDDYDESHILSCDIRAGYIGTYPRSRIAAYRPAPCRTNGVVLDYIVRCHGVFRSLDGVRRDWRACHDQSEAWHTLYPGARPREHLEMTGTVSY